MKRNQSPKWRSCATVTLLTGAAGGLMAGPNSVAAQCHIEQVLKILPDDGAEDDRFGWSVAISGDTVIIGMPFDDDNGSSSGSVYLFDMTTGAQIGKLLPNDGELGDLFGARVATSGGIAVIGAVWDDDNGDRSGSAYLFEVGSGIQIAKLLSNDGAEEDRFGHSVAISGDIAIVGAVTDEDNGIRSGSAYLFDVTTGTQIAKLLPKNGAADDQFGISVAISGDLAAVGASTDDDNGFNSGSAYLFDVSTGVQSAQLLPNDGAAGDLFGGAIAISGNIVIVGATGNDGDRLGAAYLFDRTTGAQLGKLVQTDARRGDGFGVSVALIDQPGHQYAIVGAYEDNDNGIASGSVYLFDATTGTQITKLLPDDRAHGDAFGAFVAANDERVISSSVYDDDNGFESGSVYVFALNSIRCCADSATQIRGIPLDGDFSDTCGSDDVRWEQHPDAWDATVTAPIDIQFDDTAPFTDGFAIRFVVEDAAAEPGVALHLSLFNFTTGQYEGAVFPNIPTTDTEHVIERTTSVADYIGSNNEVRGRISYTRPAGVPPFWTIAIDEVRFELDF